MFVMRKIEVRRYNERQRYPMLSGFLFRLGEIPHCAKAERHPLLQVLPFHDGIEETVLEQEFRALEAFWQVLANGLFDYAWTGESNQCIGLSDIDVAEHGK